MELKVSCLTTFGYDCDLQYITRTDCDHVATVSFRSKLNMFLRNESTMFIWK